MATRFLSTARTLLRKMSDLAFDMLDRQIAKEDMLRKALDTAFEKGKKEGMEFRTNAKPPYNPEGGWLPPVVDELHDFWTECQEEANRRFGLDEDRDACVVVRMTDRSRYEHVHFEPIPREIEESPYHPYGNRKWGIGGIIDKKHPVEEEETRRKAILENKMWIIRLIGMNLKMASDRMDQLMRDLEYSTRKEAERPEKDRAARIKTLEYKKQWWADPVKSLRKSGYEVDTKEGVYWSPDKPKDFKFPKTGNPNLRPLPTKPENFDALMKELEALKKFKPAPMSEL